MSVCARLKVPVTVCSDHDLCHPDYHPDTHDRQTSTDSILISLHKQLSQIS